MGAFTVFKLKELSPIHLGKGTDDYSSSVPTLSSDSLSSALAAVRARQGRAEGIESFLDSFLISDAFPFAEGRLFLPKPVGRINADLIGMDEALVRKRLKKIEYVELPVWADLLMGSRIAISSEQISGRFLTCPSAADFDNPVIRKVSQRVAVPRNGADANPFFFEWSYFKKDCGLFCLVKADKDTVKELESLFNLLGETGIGSDRSIGGGHFSVEISSVELIEVEDPSSTMILSSYLPTCEEVSNLDLPASRYQLVFRRGFMAGSSDLNACHYRRKDILLFRSGSLFRPSIPLGGQIVDLKPDIFTTHPVYRSGKPLCIRTKL